MSIATVLSVCAFFLISNEQTNGLTIPLWSEWADDGACSTTCGPGTITQSRTRNCTQSTCCPANFTSSEMRTVDCEICTCPVIGAWCPWADSGQCSVTCGDGTKMQARTRECTNTCTPCGCVKREERTVSCKCYPCKMSIATVLSVYAILLISIVQTKGQSGRISISNNWPNQVVEGGIIVFSLTREGGFSGDISVNVSIEDITTEPEDTAVGFGFRTIIFTFIHGENRTVIPIFVNEDTLPEETEEFRVRLTGGAVGNQSQATGFILDNDLLITEWSEWANDGICSTTCGSGSQMQSRTRNCADVCPDELALEETRTVICSNCACPVISQWTEWADNGTCSTTCGPGTITQSRTRTCTPSTCCPANVTLNEMRTVDCEICSCPVIGAWCPWADSGQCSVTCGDGTKMQARTRECTNTCTPCGCVKREERTVSCKCYPCSSTCDGQGEDILDSLVKTLLLTKLYGTEGQTHPEAAILTDM